MLHTTTSRLAGDLHHQDHCAIAAYESRSSAGASTRASRLTLFVFMAVVAAVPLSQAMMPASSFAASHINVLSGDVPMAKEEPLTTGPHAYSPAGSVRTVAQLTIPAGAHWETQVSSGSLLLTVASGALRVAINDGTARIVHPSGANTLHELTPGDSVVLVARDRLVMRGGSLLTGNVGQDPVVASVIRVR